MQYFITFYCFLLYFFTSCAKIKRYILLTICNWFNCRLIAGYLILNWMVTVEHKEIKTGSTNTWYHKNNTETPMKQQMKTTIEINEFEEVLHVYIISEPNKFEYIEKFT